MLLQQENLSIHSTTTEKRRLPTIPTVKTTTGTEQIPKGTVQLSDTEKQADKAANTPLVKSASNRPISKRNNNKPLIEPENENSSCQQYEHSTPIININGRRLAGGRVLQEKEPNYKQMAYFDARNYGETLTKNKEPNTVVKGYLQGKLEWKE